MQTILEKNLILFLLIFINLDTAFGQCQPGWTSYGVSCYQFFSNQETWNDARTNCQNLGADLVVIKDVDESNFLHNTLISADVWLGLRDITVEGEWVWIENGECTNYTNFNSGEPNNAGNEDCVELDHSNSDKWNDLNCNTLLGYVCEMFEDTEDPTLSSCPSNQNINTDANQNYGTMTWTEPIDSDNECVISVLSDYSSGDTISLSAGLVNTITNTYTATDRAGNTGTCTFSVTVTDAENPTYDVCPSSITQNTDAGQSYATVTWTSPTFTDNSGLVSVTASHTSGTQISLNGGLTNTVTVTYDGDDPAGNTAQCTFDITVSDTENPTYDACPSTITQNTDASRSYATVTWTIPTYTDNSEQPVTVIASHIPSILVPLNSGLSNTITVTYDATDRSGNSAVQCTFDVVVSDNEDPTYVGCPSDIQQDTDASQSYATVTWTQPSFFDNSGISPTVVPTHIPSVVLSLNSGLQSTTTVSYVGTDASGNSNECTFNITVSDTEVPTYNSCPSSMTPNTDAGQSYATVTWTIPVFSDNSGETVTVTASHTPNIQAELNAGLTNTVTVTYDGVDPSGNTAQCTFDITVSDVEIPVISGCPSDASFFTDVGQPYATTMWTEPTYSDNSGLYTASSTQSPGYQLNLAAGTTATETITYTLSDPSTNTAAPCTFTITVSDNESPTLDVCPSDQDLSTAAGVDSQTFTWTPPMFSDNSGENAVVTESHSSGTQLALTSGLPTSVTVTYEATDPSGNTLDCVFNLTVSDTENPTYVNCSSNILQDTDASQSYAIVTWTEPTFSDNSGLSPTVVQTHIPSIIVSLSSGLPTTVTVSYDGTDVAGNSNECTFNITVSDAEDPTYDDCPSSMTPNTEAGQSYANVTWTIPNFEDNCGEPVAVTASHTPSIQAQLNSGLTNTVTVTYVGTDPAGNTAQCIFNITVSDIEDPVYDACPADIVLDTEPGLDYATATWSTPTFTDNSGETVAVTESHNSPYQATLSSGLSSTVTVTYYGTDPSMNSRTCNFTVTVNDNQNPLYDVCPEDQSLILAHDMDHMVVTWTEPVFTDNSGIVNVTSTHMPNTAFYDNADVVYTATDSSGFVNASCTFHIEVLDKQPPDFANCPNDTEASTLSGSKLQVIEWDELVISDNVDPNPILTSLSIHSSGDAYFLGPGYDIVYKATDESGNTGYCNFTILIIDTEPPAWSNCPENKTLVADQGLSTTHSTWASPSVTDNSGTIAFQSQSYQSGDSFSFGTTTVTYTAADDSGNVGNCTFTVTITDDQLPSFGNTCPSDITTDTESGENYANVNWTVPSATDNVEVDTVVSTLDPVVQITFEFGLLTTVNYTATDTSGNQVNCEFVIEVQDSEVPDFAGCPSNIQLPTDPSSTTGTSAWSPPSASDNVEVDHLQTSASHIPGSQFPIGDTTIRYEAFDTSGNMGVCTFVVTIYDDQPPIINNCPANQSIETNLGEAVSTFSWTPPVATDNVGVESFVESHSPGSDFPVGVTDVTYTATDAAQLESECLFQLTVIDNEPPAITCPSNTSHSTDLGQPSTAVTWPNVTATDNSGSVTISSSGHSSESGDTFTIGSTTLLYEATDSSSNSATCSFTITVTDDEDPVLSNAPEDISMSTDPGVSTAVVTWTEPAATDNSNEDVTISTDVASGSTFNIGETTVSYTATDVNGNELIHTFTVTISDDEPPTISNGPTNITSSSDPGEPDAVITWTEPTATDNSGDVTLTSTHSSSSAFAIGTTTVVYTATDTFGNTDTYSFEVVVEDNEDPVISCPVLAPTIATDSGKAYATVTIPSATATDNSDSVTMTTSGVQTQYNFQFPVVPYTVSINAEDPSGNSAVCSFDITITDEEPPTVVCPSDITRNTDSGEATATVSWSVTAFDNADTIVTVTGNGHSYSSGDSLPIGENTLSFIATDDSGNTGNCQFVFTIVDNERPVISNGPSTITVDIPSDSSMATASWVPPTATDNSGSVIITSNFIPGDLFPVGTTAVTYIATDPSGNSVDHSFNVVVSDISPPEFDGTCPADVLVNNDNGNAGAVVTWTEPIPIDNSGVIESLESTHSSGTTFDIGESTVTYTATDPSQNSNTCTFTVTVQDIEPPVFQDCPDDITVSTSPGVNTGYVEWTEPSGTDNSGVVTISSTDSIGDYTIGTVAISYVALDAASPPNAATCTFQVTVEDNESPILANIPSDIVQFAELDETSSAIDWATPTASDNSGSTTVTSTHSPGDDFAVGVTTVTYTVMDDSGNSISESFTVTVYEHDTTPPEISNAPSDITTDTEQDSDTATVTWTSPSITDNVGVIDITSSHTSGDQFPIGETTVTYSATDLAGNEATSIFTITIEDNQLPELSNLPEDLSLTLDTGSSMAIGTWSEPTATDNSADVAVTSDYSSGDAFSVGTTTVTITATDGSGNVVTHTFDVAVIDDQTPTINGCLGDIIATTDESSNTVIVEWQEPTATDNHEIDYLTPSTPSNSAFPVGDTTVTYTAADVTGNIATCEFTITVTDNQPPTFESCPSEAIVQTVPIGSGTVSVLLPDTGPTDNVGVQETTASHESGDEFNIGSTTVIVTTSDQAGNTAECSYIVEVEDTEDPVFIGCPLAVEQPTDTGTNEAVVEWTEPDATDNSGNPTVTRSHEPGEVFPLGITTVTYTAVDTDSNVAICSFAVQIIDEEPPVFTSAPEAQSENTAEGSATAVVTWDEPEVTDNAGSNPTVSNDAPENNVFPIGDTTVTYTAVDQDGNEITHSFVVTVTDNELPVIANLPEDVELSTDPGESTATHSWTSPTATDNSGSVEMVATVTSPFSFPIGSTVVWYEATDPSGNTFTDSFTVVVTDNEDPELVSSTDDATGSTDAGSSTGTVFWTPPTFSENTDDLIVSSTHVPGDSFPIGTTIVTYTALDGAGNTVTTSFDVTIEDDEPPVFVGVPDDVTITLDTGESSALASWTAPTASDNSGSTTVSSSHNPDTSFPIGETVVTYTAADNAGNFESVSFTVNIVDDELPEVTCPDGLNVDTDEGVSTAAVTWDIPSVSDNSGEPTVTSSSLPGDTFPLGITPVLYTVTDLSNNVATCSFYVFVRDVEPPMVENLPGDVQVEADQGTGVTTVEWDEPITSDNAGTVTVTKSHESPSEFPVGDTIVTYTFIDETGNSLTHTFTVTVEDTQEPSFTSVPTTVSTSADEGSSGAVVQWSTPTAEDNSGTVVVTTNPPSGSFFPIGITQVTVTATDSDGNTVVETFDVTVTDDENPEFYNCPTDTIEHEVSSETTVEVTWTEPTATDNHGVFSVMSSHNPGDRFSIGTTAVSYTAIDISGNTVVCNFPVTIIDDSVPVFNDCPTDMFECTDVGVAFKILVWTEPTVEDNVGVSIVDQNFESGSSFEIGDTAVLYTATDAAENIGSCSFIISITDCEPPVLSNIPSDIEVYSNPGSSSVVVTWSTPTTSDNSGNQPTLTPNIQPGSVFEIGTTQITYTSTDADGNSVERNFTVTVLDNENPMLEGCPSDIIADSSVVDWASPSAVDNSGAVTITSTYFPGDTFDAGSTEVVYTATDVSGNTVQCQFTVTVIDTTAPVITCPDSQEVSTDFRQPEAVVTWGNPDVIDQTNVVLTASVLSGTSFDVGVHVVTYTAVNMNGFESDCTFTITVIDDEIPQIINCPEDFSQVGSTVHWPPPTASDNTEDVTLLSDHQPGSSFPVGVTSVEYTAMDQYNNFNYCIFRVTVEADGAPVVETCPSTIQLEAEEGTSAAVATWTIPTATDDQGVTSITPTHSPGDEFSIGTTIVEYTFQDASGNTAICTFSVVVSPPTDNQNPMVSCPDDVEELVNVGTTSTTVNWEEAVATDNVGIQQLLPTHDPSTPFQLGTTEVVYVAIDTSGNTAKCTFTVTVEEIVDSNAPTINGCPNDISVETSAGNIPLPISWVAPTASDNSGEVELDSNFSPGSSFGLGTTTVVYTASDTSSNIATCTFDIEVSEAFVDTESPAITGCPSDISVTASLGQTSASVSWTAPTATDNSGTPVVVTSHNPGDTFQEGTATVMYTAIDASGNHAECSFTVTVISQTDSTAPTFTSFPSDIEKIVAPGTDEVIVTWNNPVASDASGSPTLNSQYTSGQTFPVGTTVVVYTATDSSGNMATEMFTVTVTVDDTPPTIMNVPDDIEVTVTLGVTSTTVSWTEPTATDESGTVTRVGPNISPGSSFSVGTTTVSYSFVDKYGNTATTQFDITVQNEDDTEPPFIFGCSGNISTVIQGASESVAVSWTQPTATDNSGFFTTVSNHSPGDFFSEGTTVVTYTYTDSAGNTATCSFNVIVTDLISFTCPVDETAIAMSSLSLTAVEWIEPSIDESSGFFLSSTHESGALFPVGTTVVTYTAQDNLQNTVTCSFSVIVSEQDTTPPVITNMPSDITASTTAGRNTATLSWNIPTATDNSNSFQLVGSHDPPAQFEVGTTVVTYNATDGNGNSASHSFTVTVQDNERPSISGCPSSQVYNVLDSSSTALAHWDEPTTTDNAGNATLTVNVNPGDRLTPGQYIVTYTATDQSGNTASCSFIVSVSLSTVTREIQASTAFDTVSGFDGVIPQDDMDALIAQLEQDIEDVIRRSSLASSVVGVSISSISYDENNNPIVDYTLVFNEGSSVTDSEVESILNGALAGDTLPSGNTVRDGAFYIGEGQCAEITCQNDGVCIRIENGYNCQCTSSWSGDLCETDVNECTTFSNICSSNRFCKNTYGGYSCNCQPGFHLKDSVCVLSKEITGEFAIAEIGDDTAIFTDAYSNTDSAEYLELEAEVVAQLTDVFQSLPGFVGVIVFGFSSGSIKVQYIVQFDFESNTTVPDVNTIFNDHVANDGILNDSILDLEPESYSVIEEICTSDFCKNGGECTVNQGTYASMCICLDGYTGENCEEEDISTSVTDDDFQMVGIVLGSLAAFIFIFVILAGFCCWLIAARRRHRKGALYDGDDHQIIGTPTVVRAPPVLVPAYYPSPIADNGYNLREESIIQNNLDDIRVRSVLGDGFLNPYVASGFVNKAHAKQQFDDGSNSDVQY